MLKALGEERSGAQHMEHSIRGGSNREAREETELKSKVWWRTSQLGEGGPG